MPLNEPHITGHARIEMCVHVCTLVTECDNGASSGTIQTKLLEEGLTDGLTVEVWDVGGHGEPGQDRVLCRTWPPHASQEERAASMHASPLFHGWEMIFY